MIHNLPESIRWAAPAKLNLFLHIISRRDDGYHELQTVFQFLDIHDELIITVNDLGIVRCSYKYHEIPEQDDLTIRAARLLQQVTGCALGADIELIKHLPAGGGIGGGSSDAATALVVLNHLWQTGLGAEELAELGLQLGADVPVFIYGRACWAEGIGENLTPIELPEDYYVVIFPNVRICTRQVFASKELTRNTPPIKITSFLEGQTVNDCEAVVRQQVEDVDEAMNWLGQFAKARLTGTGACVFAAFDTKKMAQRVAGRCPENWQCFVAKGNNQSMLHRQIQDMR